VRPESKKSESFPFTALESRYISLVVRCCAGAPKTFIVAKYSIIYIGTVRSLIQLTTAQPIQAVTS
jgi:hypothetical protein